MNTEKEAAHGELYDSNDDHEHIDAEGESDCDGEGEFDAEGEGEIDSEGNHEPNENEENEQDFDFDNIKAQPLPSHMQPAPEISNQDNFEEEQAEGDHESDDSEELADEEDMTEIKHEEIIGSNDFYYSSHKTKPGFCDYDGEKQITSNQKSTITATLNKEEQNRVRVKDKNDRATVDQVLDPRTLRVLHKWLKNGTLSEIFGSISTGKEANVYYAYRKPTPKTEEELHAEAEEAAVDKKISRKTKKQLKSLLKAKHEEKVARAVLNFDSEKDFAVKIYKTTVLVFRDRERYIEGEFRFRKAKYKNNPMKMVKQWAEKEMRNLKRLKQSGLNVPDAYLLK